MRPPMRTVGSLTLCRSLLEADLVDRFRVVVFPVITGATGRERIFDGYPDVALELVDRSHLRRPAPDARVRPDGACRTTWRRASWTAERLSGQSRYVKLVLDLHDIYDRGQDIDRALRAIIDEAVAKKAPLVEIIPGKGSGALKKRVLRFLDQKEIKALYHRVEKDSHNHGRLFVHFRW